MAKQTESNNIRRPSTGGTIAKLVFGVILAGTSFGDPGDSDPVYFLVVGLAIGLGLIAWALLPWLSVRKQEKRLAAQEEERKRELARIRAEEKAERESEIKICPACGATSRGKVCEYCGTKLP